MTLPTEVSAAEPLCKECGRPIRPLGERGLWTHTDGITRRHIPIPAAPQPESVSPPPLPPIVHTWEDMKFGHEYANCDDDIGIAADLNCRERQLTSAHARIQELERERDHVWTQRNADLFAERNKAWDDLRAAESRLAELLKPIGERPEAGIYHGYIKEEMDPYIDALTAQLHSKSEEIALMEQLRDKRAAEIVRLRKENADGK